MKTKIGLGMLLLALCLSACRTAAPEEAASETAENIPETVSVSPYLEPSEGALFTSALNIAHTIPGEEVMQNRITRTFSQGNEIFSLQEADAEGTAVTLRASTVSALHVEQAFQDGTTAAYQMKVQVTKVKESPWNALYIGLRLNSAAADPTSQSGIWLALTRNEIGIRTGNWPETSYIPIQAEGIDFSAERMLYIEDDMASDTITVWADDDSGTKTTIAVVKLENGKICLYPPDSDKAGCTDTILNGIASTGYSNIWLHHTQTPAYITDFSASGVERIRETAEAGNMMNTRDVFADTWVSVDDEGRVTGTDNGTVSEKKVGIFYFIWHDGTTDQPIYDHSAAYERGGTEALKEIMTQGPMGFAHYWAEPYFGYYRSDDEWVIRKHTYQLNAAGVDFIFIDATNGLTYENNYETILKVWSEMRAEGYNTPQIMFHCGNEYNLAQASFSALWKNLYSTGRYEDLWFRYEGKPLILAPASFWADQPEEIQNFFTCRQSWAYTKEPEGGWYTATNGNNCWPWADIYPQSPGKSPDGKIEQMIVMSGFWVNGSFGTNAGRSYHNGLQPANKTDSDFGFSLAEDSSGKGYAFEEQFDYAIEKDPDIIMLTGWNEWWAGRWEAGPAVGQTIANTYTVTADGEFTKHYYVDAFNPEFSRDIEPVKGYYNDNYYYQMAQNIRQYKGSRTAQAAFGQKTIDITGTEDQWYAVGPEYRDYTGDTASRDADSYVGQLHYTNTSGRNDFETCKVSRDGEYLYFYAQCSGDITAPAGTNWMNLFIDADCDRNTGWYGYDYVLNRTQNGNTCSVMQFTDNTWKMQEIGTAEFTVRGKVMQIKVKADLLGVGDTFDFKWADNSVDTGDIMQFIDQGDAAPNDRFNYRYTTEADEMSFPDVLTEDMIVLKAGSYHAFAGGRMVMLDPANTNAVFCGDADGWYVPKSFAEDTMGLVFAEESAGSHYGTEYVNIQSALESTGKTVTVSDSMVVIAENAIGEEEMLTLYRALY